MAVSVTVFEEFSISDVADKLKVTSGASSLSSILTVIALLSAKVAFEGVPGVIIIVSVNSSLESSTEANVTVPVVSPANIFNWGDS